MNDIYTVCSINEPQKHNMTIGEWLDKKLKDGDFNNLLLKKISSLQSALTGAQEENKLMKEVLVKISKDPYVQPCILARNLLHNMEQSSLKGK